MNKKTTAIVIAAALVLTAAIGIFGYLSFQSYRALSVQLEENAGRVTNVAGQIDSMREEVHTRTSLMQANMDSVRETIEKMNGPQQTQEDEVTIANEYVILPTTQISDAYVNGDASALSDKDKETLDMAASVLKEIINDRMDPYEKELAVYQWMTTNLKNDPGILPVVPTTQADCDNPYGVLKYHNAVCVGYATTFRLFMQMLQIPCKVIHNQECFHSWDLVQLNGHWYHTDVYSDVGTCNYLHFNRTDAMQQADQNWDTEYFPKSDSVDDCFAVRNAVRQNDVFKIPAKIRKALDEGSNFMAFTIPKEADDHSARVLQNMMERIKETIDYASDCGGISINWQWVPLDRNYVISISISTYDPEPDAPVLPEEDLNRIENTLTEAFGDYDVYCD